MKPVIKPTEHVIYTVPAPVSMIETFKKCRALRNSIKLFGEAMSPHERSIRLEYVDCAMKYEMAKFQYDLLDDPGITDKIRYSHSIELKGEDIIFKRGGKKDPGILEIMNSNHNLKLN